MLADILKLHENKIPDYGQSDNSDMEMKYKSDNAESTETAVGDKRESENTIWPEFIPSGNYTPWEHVQLARAKTRPTGKDYIEALFDDFLHRKKVRAPGKILTGILEWFLRKATGNLCV